MAVYAPTLLFSIGVGAMLPQVALTARDLGASVFVAGLAVTARGVGALVFDLPAGLLIARVGERWSMLVASVTLAIALAGCIVATSPFVLVAWMFLVGCGWSVWLLARLAYIADVMPMHLRGRSLSTMGGVHRIGVLIGPFVGAAAVTVAGFDGAYWVHLVLALVGAVLLYVVPDPHPATPPDRHARLDVIGIGRRNAGVFLIAGTGVVALSVLRAARQVVIPLWGVAIGLGPAEVSVIFGISAALEVVMFYPAGTLSDRFGRKASAVPCMALLSIGTLMIPLTATFAGLAVAGVVQGIGNGLGSGIVMTLGADYSPAEGRAEFLGAWRLVGDVGSSGGPLLASALAAASLTVAAIAVGLIGLAGAGLVLFRLPPRPEG